MAEPYDVLASLNRMLESEERREQYKLQASLSLMQFAQQKRLQDIQLAGQRLELLQAANTQMIESQAQAFLEDSGLKALYLKKQHEDPDQWFKNYAIALAKGKSSWSYEGFGFTDATAERIAVAVLASEAGNHKAIMSIANEIGLHIDNTRDGIPDTSTNLQKELFNVFSTSPGGEAITADRIDEMQRTTKNQSLILKEMVDFGHGEYNISPEISFDEILSSPEEEIVESMFNISSQESPELGEDDTKSVGTGTTLSDDSSSVDKQISNLAIEISGQQEDITNINKQVSLINSKRLSGVKLNEDEQKFFNQAAELRSLAEAEMSNLNSEIDDLRQDQADIESAKRLHKVNVARATPMLGHTIMGANRAGSRY